MHEEKHTSAHDKPPTFGALCPPWQLIHRTQCDTPDGGYHDTCLYRVKGGRVALVQLKCHPYAEPWVEMIELTPEEGRQFGHALGE